MSEHPQEFQLPLLNRSNVLVLVPAFNEERSVFKVIRNIIDMGYTTLLVDDGSTDQTSKIARSAGAHVLELPYNLGVGGALRAGFRYAIRKEFEAVIQVDADGQHPAEEIKNLIDAANTLNAHMVIGSRFLNNSSSMKISFVRKIGMKLLSVSASWATGQVITDSTSGFRIIRNPLLEKFSRNFANNYLGDTYEAIIAAARSQHRVVEIPANLTERFFGQSSATSGSALLFTLKGLAVSILGLHKRL